MIKSDLERDDALLLNLAVFSSRMDAVDHIALAFLSELSLEDPGVHVDPNLGHGVGTVRPTVRFPLSTVFKDENLTPTAN